MRSFGLTDATGNTYGFPRVVVYGPDGKIKFPSGGGGGSGTVTSIGITVPSGFSVTPATITTSGTFAITGAGTASDYIDGTGALQTFPTINTYTVSNGLYEDPANNFKLGGNPLVEDTAIDGDANQYGISFTNLKQFEVNTDYKVLLQALDGTDDSNVSMLPNQVDIGAGATGSGSSAFSKFTTTKATLGFVTPGGNLEISADATTLNIKTPDVRSATATVGQVLTLQNATTGEVEFQTPTSGGLPYGIASGTNNYTVTIAGVTGYTDGDTYIIKFTNGNDADSDIDINGLGVKTLVKEFNVQITGGDIVSGQELIIIYDGTNFQTLGVAPNQLFAYVTNDDTVTITKGQPVYAFGAAGNRMSVKLAANTSDATSAQTVGVVFSTSIAPNQRGFVICQGVISGVNTAAYSPGNQLYLGATAGTLTATKPYAPNHLVYIGIVERANAGNGQIYIKPQNGYELDELHNVQAQSPSVNDILYYFGGSPGQWKTAPISTVLGYTPQAQLNGTGFVKATGTTISYDNSTYLTSAVTSFNSLTGATQTLATGTTGTDFGISSAGTTHTFNLPTASATNRGALSSADWSTFNGKQDSIGLTTVGTNLATLPNPSAISYLRVNADNTVTALTLAQLKSDLGMNSAVLASDATTALTNTFEDIGLSFAVTSGKVYKWKAVLSAGATSSSTFAVTGPTYTFMNYRYIMQNAATTISIFGGVANDTGTNAAMSSNGTLIAEGILKPSANGTFKLRFRSLTAGTLTVRAGSTIEWSETL